MIIVLGVGIHGVGYCIFRGPGFWHDMMKPSSYSDGLGFGAMIVWSCFCSYLWIAFLVLIGFTHYDNDRNENK